MNWTAISVFVAAIGVVYTARLRRILSRKQHTLTSILQVTFNDVYVDGMKRVSRMIRTRQCPPPLGEDEIDDEELSRDVTALKAILNYWEFLCAGLRAGDIDEQILTETRGGAIMRAYRTFRPYIDGRREAVGSEKIYEHIQWYYERRSSQPAPFGLSILEFVMGRPMTRTDTRNFSYRNQLVIAARGEFNKAVDHTRFLVAALRRRIDI